MSAKYVEQLQQSKGTVKKVSFWHSRQVVVEHIAHPITLKHEHCFAVRETTADLL